MMCIPILCSCRFFLMYLINKDETEYTGQVGCFTPSWKRFSIVTPACLLDVLIPELAMLMTRFYSNLFQEDKIGIQAVLQNPYRVRQTHYDDNYASQTPWLYFSISLKKTSHVDDSGRSNQVFKCLSPFRQTNFTSYLSGTIFLTLVCNWSLWKHFQKIRLFFKNVIPALLNCHYGTPHQKQYSLFATAAQVFLVFT